jgi:adenylate cyclase
MFLRKRLGSKPEMAIRTGVLALPLAGLGLLLAAPDADVHWEHHPAHFWLVLLIAAVSVVLGLLASEAARRLDDARLFLVSMTFLASAGFLGLHALATPGVLLNGKNTGFVIATPVGLLVASGFAAASALDLAPDKAGALMRHRTLVRNALIAALAAWAAVSLAAVPPLDEPLPPEDAKGRLYALAFAGVALYAFAALRYLRLYRQRPARMLLSIFASLVLLAEAMIAIALSRNWHASWWEWHLLMAAAFGLVAVTARDEYRARRSLGGVFSDLYLQETIDRVDSRYGRALQRLVDSPDTLDDLRERERLSAEEADLLGRAAGEIRQLDELFRPYLSPQLAARLRTDPDAAALGGEQREVSILFADLEGFTAFSERTEPARVIEMLNDYWAHAVPAVAEEGGMVERFAGDAVMVVFNAAQDQPDHALRAARAALALQRATEAVAAKQPGWPRFRAGVNTGPAVIGNVGSVEHRSFAAIGDTTNLAARLQAAAKPGQVVIGETTREALGDVAIVEALGRLDLKGKREPVEAFLLVQLGRDPG